MNQRPNFLEKLRQKMEASRAKEADELLASRAKEADRTAG